MGQGSWIAKTQGWGTFKRYGGSKARGYWWPVIEKEKYTGGEENQGLDGEDANTGWWRQIWWDGQKRENVPKKATRKVVSLQKHSVKTRRKIQRRKAT